MFPANDTLAVGMLVWVRVAAALVASPIFGSVSAPAVFKVLLTLFLSVAIAMGLAAHPGMAALPDTTNLPALMLGEAFIGMTLGFGLHAAFAAFSIAGKLLDIQIGFGLGATYDPVLRSHGAALSVALSMYAVLIFFLAGAHHGLVRGLAFSFERMPVGTGVLGPAALQAVVAQFGAMFTLAVVIVAPVIFGLLLVETGLSVLSRVMPQMNIIFVGVPVKIFAGLSLLALLAPHLHTPTAHAMRDVFVYFEKVAP